MGSSSDEDLAPFSALRKELEVIVVHIIQKLIGPVLEPSIQRVVKEQIDLAQERIITSMNQPSRERPNSSSQRRLKLRFRKKPSDPVLTGKPISGEDRTALKIELVDENTNLIVKTGPQSSGRVEIAVLRADTKRDENEGNTSLRHRCTYLDLNEGIGLVGKISFPHGSKWTKKCRYMLMARFVDPFNGISVIEAKSEVFTLEDRRNKQYEKHYPPTLSDVVLRLVNISKGGPYEKLLKDKNIITVKNFLTEHFKNHQRLKEILKMPEKKLNDTIAHALTCKELRDKYIYYIPGSQQQMGVVLNAVGQLFGVISKCHFIPIGTLPETQKDDARKSVASALENWGDVVRYNENSLYSASTDLVSRDYTPSSAEYDYTQPCISSPIFIPPAILMGASQINVGYESCDHTQPSTFCANAVLPNFLFRASNVNGKYGLVPPITPSGNITLSDIFIGTSLVNGGYDHTQPNTSYAKATLSNILVETSQINGRSDVKQPSTSLFSPGRSNDTSHDNCEYDDVQPIAALEDIMPLNDTFSYPFGGTSDGVYSGPPNLFDMEFGTSNDFLYEFTRSWDDIPDHVIQDPNFSIDEYYDPDERLKKDISKISEMLIL